jgi:hypothetical protein
MDRKGYLESPRNSRSGASVASPPLVEITVFRIQDTIADLVNNVILKLVKAPCFSPLSPHKSTQQG